MHGILLNSCPIEIMFVSNPQMNIILKIFEAWVWITKIKDTTKCVCVLEKRLEVDLSKLQALVVCFHLTMTLIFMFNFLMTSSIVPEITNFWGVI